ncbi:MAG TPA: hypothetical protein VLK25_01990 [Allosphingosinicella sp.]|nr:hypothetical protein [Allosphingosinicella sp.]
MITRKLIIASVLAAGIAANPGPALALADGPVYNIHYYSDASLTTEVGIDYGTCFYFGPGWDRHEGQSTQYTWYEQVGNCINGQWEPI